MLSIWLSDGTRGQRHVVSLRVILIDHEGVFSIGQGIWFLQGEIARRFERFRLTEDFIARHVEHHGFVRLGLLLSSALREVGRVIHRTIERGGIIEDISLSFLRRCRALRLIVRDTQLILLFFVLLDLLGSVQNFFTLLRLLVD